MASLNVEAFVSISIFLTDMFSLLAQSGDGLSKSETSHFGKNEPKWT
jgi:hypothetical protein